MNNTSIKRSLACIFTAAVALGTFTERTLAQSDPSAEADAAFKEADTQLNLVYKELLKAISKPETRDYFARAQRAWISFRDKEAAFRTELYDKGGIVWAHDYTVERTTLTNERIKQIQRIKAEYLRSR